MNDNIPLSLNRGEKVLWTGNPGKIFRFSFANIVEVFNSLIILTLIAMLVRVAISLNYNTEKVSLFILGIILFLTISAIYKILKHLIFHPLHKLNVRYVVTNKRVVAYSRQSLRIFFRYDVNQLSHFKIDDFDGISGTLFFSDKAESASKDEQGETPAFYYVDDIVYVSNLIINQKYK